MNLSAFFSLEELTHSDTAKREGIANQPSPDQIEQLRTLAKNVLDPLREAAQCALRVTSGYRGPALNARVGGSATSQHSLGQAADLQATKMSALQLFQTAIRAGLPFDQLIYEAQNATVKWVHVSHAAGKNRGEIRVARFDARGKPTDYPRVTAEEALAMRDVVTRSAVLREAYVESGDEPQTTAPADTPPATPATRKPAARKAAAGKAAATKAAAPNAPARKTAPAAAPVKKAAAKKSAATAKAPAKKAAAAPKKAATKKAAAAPKSAAAKKAAPRKSAAQPSTPQHAAAKKRST